MALNSNAFAGKPATNKPTEARPAQLMLKEGGYQMEYLGVSERQGKSFDDRNKRDDDPTIVLQDEVAFKFVVLVAGADAAQTALEALPFGDAREAAFTAFKTRYLAKGHGRYFWLNATKVQPKLPIEGQRTSNLYLHLRALLNDGVDFTPTQMQSLLGDLNALEGIGADGKLIAGFSRPQYSGYLEANKNSGKNKLVKISYRVPEDEELPSYRELARVIDPRETTEDDATIVCSVTGDKVHGFEAERDGDRVWISNTELAEAMVRKVGRVLRNDLYRAELRKLNAGGAVPVAVTSAALATTGRQAGDLF